MVVLQAPSVYSSLHEKMSKMAKERRRNKLNIGCWNIMRTLAEAEGNIVTSVARPGSRSVPVDRKAMLMVQELRKYKMNVTGISETKWFGQEIYNINDFTVLHSGHPIPTNREAAERNKGVGIVLDPRMSEAWRNSGGVWKAISSRLVLARMKMESGRGRRGSTTRPLCITIVSAYAPTHRSTQEKKDEFFTDLQSTLNGVHEDDVLLLLGDFNARVGSSERQAGNSNWSEVRGCHGVGRKNESGEALLSFCTLNKLVIINTTFQKNNIYKHIWQYPGSKQWHCIDYIIMRQSQRKLCCDSSVLRSAEYWTDHKLLRAQLKLQVPAKVPRAKPRKRFAISGLWDDTVQKKFNETISNAVEEEWSETASGEQKWEVIRDVVVKIAENILGYEKRRQPEENEATLKRLIDKRNTLFNTWHQRLNV